MHLAVWNWKYKNEQICEDEEEILYTDSQFGEVICNVKMLDIWLT